MNTTRLQRQDVIYPVSLPTHPGDNAPTSISAMGDIEILGDNALALFCSVRCPGKLILQTYDLALALRRAGRTVIGGFHSPMEKECLTLLLRGTQPVVVCPARGRHGMRLAPEWKAALSEGRLLLLSPFKETQRRASVETARNRNKFVAALAGEVFVAYAAPGGRTEAFCRDVVAWGKPLLTLDSRENAGLLALGARALHPDDLGTTPGPR